MQQRMWDKVKSKAFVKPFFTAVGGLVLVLQGGDSALQITQYVQKLIEQ